MFKNTEALAQKNADFQEEHPVTAAVIVVGGVAATLVAVNKLARKLAKKDLETKKNVFKTIHNR